MPNKERALHIAATNFINKVDKREAKSTETYKAFKNALMYPSTDYLRQVTEFHELFGHPVLKQPEIIPLNRGSMRIRLLQEELKELTDAYHDNNIVEIADALADLQYVLCGAILEFGLKDKFDEIFEEVHRSNMSKVAQSEEEAIESIEHYKDLDNTIATYEEQDGTGKFFIIRLSDNKTLKPVGYSPARISAILDSE